MIATRAALKLADYVVTEAGFGADLGAEKFVDIKCRKSGLRPDAAVIVATVRALKSHGGAELKTLNQENLEALERGMANLERHVHNVRDVYGLPCVVSINHFTHDTDAELALIRNRMDAELRRGASDTRRREGAEDLAREVVRVIEQGHNRFHFVYEDDLPLWDKVKAVASKVYGAADVTADAKVRAQIARLQDEGYGRYPVCIAKTQYSFSTDPSLRGAPTGAHAEYPRGPAVGWR